MAWGLGFVGFGVSRAYRVKVLGCLWKWGLEFRAEGRE